MDEEKQTAVARMIDPEAWLAIDDGRDQVSGSLWGMRRAWALAKAAEIMAYLESAA